MKITKKKSYPRSPGTLNGIQKTWFPHEKYAMRSKRYYSDMSIEYSKTSIARIQNLLIPTTVSSAN